MSYSPQELKSTVFRLYQNQDISRDILDNFFPEWEKNLQVIEGAKALSENGHIVETAYLYYWCARKGKADRQTMEAVGKILDSFVIKDIDSYKKNKSGIRLLKARVIIISSRKTDKLPELLDDLIKNRSNALLNPENYYFTVSVEKLFFLLFDALIKRKQPSAENAHSVRELCRAVSANYLDHIVKDTVLVEKRNQLTEYGKSVKDYIENCLYRYDEYITVMDLCRLFEKQDLLDLLGIDTQKLAEVIRKNKSDNPRALYFMKYRMVHASYVACLKNQMNRRLTADKERSDQQEARRAGFQQWLKYIDRMDICKEPEMRRCVFIQTAIYSPADLDCRAFDTFNYLSNERNGKYSVNNTGDSFANEENQESEEKEWDINEKSKPKHLTPEFLKPDVNDALVRLMTDAPYKVMPFLTLVGDDYGKHHVMFHLMPQSMHFDSFHSKAETVVRNLLDIYPVNDVIRLYLNTLLHINLSFCEFMELIWKKTGCYPDIAATPFAEVIFGGHCVDGGVALNCEDTPGVHLIGFNNNQSASGLSLFFVPKSYEKGILYARPVSLSAFEWKDNKNRGVKVYGNNYLFRKLNETNMTQWVWPSVFIPKAGNSARKELSVQAYSFSDSIRANSTLISGERELTFTLQNNFDPNEDKNYLIAFPNNNNICTPYMYSTKDNMFFPARKAKFDSYVSLLENVAATGKFNETTIAKLGACSCWIDMKASTGRMYCNLIENIPQEEARRLVIAQTKAMIALRNDQNALIDLLRTLRRRTDGMGNLLVYDPFGRNTLKIQNDDVASLKNAILKEMNYKTILYSHLSPKMLFELYMNSFLRRVIPFGDVVKAMYAKKHHLTSNDTLPDRIDCQKEFPQLFDRFLTGDFKEVQGNMVIMNVAGVFVGKTNCVYIWPNEKTPDMNKNPLYFFCVREYDIQQNQFIVSKPSSAENLPKIYPKTAFYNAMRCLSEAEYYFNGSMFAPVDPEAILSRPFNGYAQDDRFQALYRAAINKHGEKTPFRNRMKKMLRK